jgi:hypothetical protein
LVGVKRETPLRRLREKLFGIDTGRVPIRPIPIDLAMRRIAPGRTVSRSEPAPAFINPVNAVAAVSLAPMPLVPAPRAPFRVEYKGQLIVVYPSADGGWTATHLPLGGDVSLSHNVTAYDKHRYMARVMAIASVQIEIDELG